MRFYVLTVSYLVPYIKVEPWVQSHRDYLQGFYDQGWILFSGIQYSKQGGAIVMKAPEDEAIARFIQNDPFLLQQVASYQVTSFEPRNYQLFLKPWIES